MTTDKKSKLRFQFNHKETRYDLSLKQVEMLSKKSYKNIDEDLTIKSLIRRKLIRNIKGELSRTKLGEQLLTIINNLK